jgi:hypothetical protein
VPVFATKSLLHDMVLDHQLNESEALKLRLFTSRTVFPLIHHMIYPDPDPGLSASSSPLFVVDCVSSLC